MAIAAVGVYGVFKMAVWVAHEAGQPIKRSPQAAPPAQQPERGSGTDTAASPLEPALMHRWRVSRRHARSCTALLWPGAAAPATKCHAVRCLAYGAVHLLASLPLVVQDVPASKLGPTGAAGGDKPALKLHA